MLLTDIVVTRAGRRSLDRQCSDTTMPNTYCYVNTLPLIVTVPTAVTNVIAAARHSSDECYCGGTTLPQPTRREIETLHPTRRDLLISFVDTDDAVVDAVVDAAADAAAATAVNEAVSAFRATAVLVMRLLREGEDNRIIEGSLVILKVRC